MTPFNEVPPKAMKTIFTLGRMCFPLALIAVAAVLFRPAVAQGAGPIQALVDAAAPGATVVVPPGNYADAVRIDKDLTLMGSGPDSPVLSGLSNAIVVQIASNATVTLSNLALASHPEGAVLNLGTLTLDHCAVTNNAWPLGGQRATGTAILNNGRLTVLDSLVAGNGRHYVDLYGAAIHSTTGASLVLSNTVLRNNAGLRNGSAIYNAGELTMHGCVVSGNSCEAGGYAIYSTGPTVVAQSRFEQNKTTPLYSGNRLTLTDCLMRRNDGEASGGLTCWGETAVTNCTFRDNTSVYRGGGIYNFGTLLLVSSTLCNNKVEDPTGGGYAGYGGGLDNGGLFRTGRATLINCTVSGNAAAYSGGGIMSSASLTVLHSTISENVSSEIGGLDLTESPTAAGSLSLRGSIVAGNARVVEVWSLSNGVWSSVSNKFISNLSSFPASGENEFNLVQNTNGLPDPLLGPLQDNGGPAPTHGLRPGSPAIDAGPPTDFPATDQRGFGRPVDGDGDGVARADMGAFEYGHLRLTEVRRRDGQWEVRGSVGVPGSDYTLEASSDLWNWSPLSTNSADASGWFTYPVTPGDPPARFYRLRQL
jgi:hypothetical protein